MNEIIFNDIKARAEEVLNVKLSKPVPINLGHMNLKWIVDAGQEKRFIKQINPTRYNEKKRTKIEKAMSIQHKLHQAQVPCPNLYADGNNYILKSKGQEYFVITDYVKGKLVGFGQINRSQMRDLGRCIGKMHLTLNSGQFPLENPAWQLPSREQMLKANQDLLLNAQETGDGYLLDLLKQQKDILETTDWTTFKSCKVGWAHSDLWSENILFTNQSVAAILDFDRLQVNYPELDNARALLSFALKDGRIDHHLVQAFIEGYSLYHDYTSHDLGRSIQLLWALESFWWLKHQYLKTDGPPRRMLYEIAWVTTNWTSLLT